MTKEEVVDSLDSLCDDIEHCTWDLVFARLKKDKREEIKALCRMETLIVASHQELSFLKEYINDVEGYK